MLVVALLSLLALNDGGPPTPAAAALVDAHRDRVLYKPCSMADLRAMVLGVVEPRAASAEIREYS